MSHAQSRAYSRYGLTLKRLEFEELKRQIVEGEAVKLKRVSKKIGVYYCILSETGLIVVYNKAKKFFITVLPMAYLEYVKKKY